MKLNEYQEETHRTAGDRPVDVALAMCGMGLAGESGEVVDHIKKHLFHGHPLNKEKLVKELGDSLWYVAAIASHIGVTLEDVAKANIEKLRKRYPNGFSVEDSLKRADGE